MDVKEFNTEFFKLEEERDLFSQQINDVYFWERIRTSVYREAANEVGVREDQRKEEDGSTLIKRLYLFLKNIFVRNPLLAKERDVIFFGQSRRKKEGGFWEDIYVDPIIEELDLDYLYLEDVHPQKNKHLRPAKTSNIRYLDLIFFGGAIPRRLGLLNVGIDEEEEKSVREIENDLENKFEADIDVMQKVKHKLSRRKIMLPLYKILLSRMDPQIVVIVKAGRYSLIEACNELDITVAELQHGFIGPYHADYAFPDTYSNPRKYAPDHMLLWGEYWKKKCNLSMDEENQKVIGFPYIEKKESEYEESGEDKNVLFLSQPKFGTSLAEEALELSKLQSKYNIFYKLHPVERSIEDEKYSLLEDSEVEVISEEPSLYELYAKSQVQVGVSSSTIYEGLNFGLETYIYDLPDAQNLSDLVDKGYAHLFSNARELNNLIEKDIDHKNDGENFFRKDSIRRIENYLKSFL